MVCKHGVRYTRNRNGVFFCMDLAQHPEFVQEVSDFVAFCREHCSELDNYERVLHRRKLGIGVATLLLPSPETQLGGGSGGRAEQQEPFSRPTKVTAAVLPAPKSHTNSAAAPAPPGQVFTDAHKCMAALVSHNLVDPRTGEWLSAACEKILPLVVKRCGSSSCCHYSPLPLQPLTKSHIALMSSLMSRQHHQSGGGGGGSQISVMASSGRQSGSSAVAAGILVEEYD
jgi:hypothetical protein